MKILQRLGINTLFFSKKDKRLAASIKVMLGSRPFNIALYKLALTPSGLAEETKKDSKSPMRDLNIWVMPF
ncbi:hypothetical protein V8V91_25280 [Algoriphagus halophilus]|uniref:hypothetical protein n=1 Tax=Algoriphagus halophilus TaxID=226505 RepID=UPI00358F69B7